MGPFRGVTYGFYGDNGKENGNYYLGFRDLGVIVPLRTKDYGAYGDLIAK